MNENLGDELLKLQLEWVKQQDRVLAEIENRIKKIAEYARRYQPSRGESEQLNKQLYEHQTAIQSLENYLS